MDIISFNEASTANGRIENFIENPDSTSGVLTVPKTIAAGETITIPAGRVAILPDLQVDGDLVVDGDLFIPTGSMTSQVVQKVTSTDNAVVRFNGTTGDVQNSGVVIDDSGNIASGSITSTNSGLVSYFGIYDNNTTQINSYSGTTGKDIVFRQYNTERMRITSNGELLVGTQNGSGIAGNVSVNGNISCGGGLLTNLYYNNGWKYLGNGYGWANYTDGNSGKLFWESAGNNTSGNGASATPVSRMCLDNSGNLGIGTSSVGARLHIKQPNDGYTSGLNIQSASNAAVRFYMGVDNATATTVISNDNHTMKIESTGANPLTLGTNGTERMRLDSAGNVGIGVIPNSWYGTYKALQINNTSLTNQSNVVTRLSTNYYIDSSNVQKYIASDYATQYTQANGNHMWYTAPSGTAGSAITWTTAMTLGSNGNLLVGTTTDNGVNKLQVNGSIKTQALTVTDGYSSFKTTIICSSAVQNVYDITISEFAASGNNTSDTGVYLLAIRAGGDATNGVAAIYTIILNGDTGILTTSLGLVTTGGNTGLGITRPSGNIIRVSTNNYGAIKNISLTRLV